MKIYKNKSHFFSNGRGGGARRAGPGSAFVEHVWGPVHQNNSIALGPPHHITQIYWYDINEIYSKDVTHNKVNCEDTNRKIVGPGGGGYTKQI